jgi:hypothetical protein
VNTIKLELTKEQAEVLKELLSLDMDRIGFDDDEVELLDEIYEKL